MAQTNFTPILLYSSSTAAAVPLAANLTNSATGSELAINITDGKLFYKDNANAVQVIGWKTVPTTAGGTGTATTFTAGSVVFANASGIYSQDNLNFFWDDANNRLGIGTATPSTTLDIAGILNTNSGATIRRYANTIAQNNGLILGTTAKASAPSGSEGVFTISSNDATNALQASFALFTSATAANRRLIIESIEQGVAYRNVTLAENGGNVGIGLVNPAYKLDVTGTANITGATSITGALTINIPTNNAGLTVTDGTYPLSITPSGLGGVALVYGNYNFIWYGNGAQRMTLFASGGVSIGNTTDPGATNLSVTGKATIQTLTIGLGASNISTNTALGFNTLAAVTTASNSVAVGYGAGASLTTGGAGGGYNTFVGTNAGSSTTTGYYHTILGFNAQASSASSNGEFVVGVNAVGKGSATGYISSGSGVYQGNNSAAWSITSDARLKKNIVNNTIGLSAITAIQVRNFEYRTKDEVTELEPQNAIEITGVQLGAVAQELQAILPDCVKVQSTGVMSVDTTNITWYLINAIKELNNKFDAYVASHP